MKAFEQQRGVLVQIGEGTSSQDLKRGARRSAKIITTTIHKFGVIAGAMGELPAKNFALIVDKARSSQSGEMRRAVHEVVARYQEIEDWVLRQAMTRQQPSDATISRLRRPRGARHSKSSVFGKPTAHTCQSSLYSMKQAIEEKFILDVLTNYTTYKAYFDLIRKLREGSAGQEE